MLCALLSASKNNMPDVPNDVNPDDAGSPNTAVRDFLRRLDELLQRPGWSRSKLARELGISRGTVTEWFTMERIPNGETLLRLGQILGTDAPVVFGLPDAPRELDYGGSGVSSPAIDLLKTVELPEGVRRVTGRSGVLSRFAHVYSIGVDEGFSDEDLAVLEKWRDAELARLREEERG